MSHTKGPWHRNIKPARKYPIIFAGRNTHICQVLNHVDDAEMEANCDLICLAPEMLAVIRLALRRLEGNKQNEKDIALCEQMDGIVARFM